MRMQPLLMIKTWERIVVWKSLPEKVCQGKLYRFHQPVIVYNTEKNMLDEKSTNSCKEFGFYVKKIQYVTTMMGVTFETRTYVIHSLR